MSIPCKMRPVGLTSLPMGYMRAEFLESSGTQYIYLDGEFTSTAVWSFSFTPTKTDNNNYFCGRNENLYAFANIVNGLVVIGSIPFADYVGFEPSTQEVYTVNFDMLNKRGFISCRDEKKEYLFKNNRVPATKALVLFGGQSTNQDTVGAVNYTSHAKMWNIEVSHDGEKTHKFIPALDSDGTPCMFDTVSHQPFYNSNPSSNAGQFIVGLTMTQALNLTNLPVTEDGTTLTVSLPLEAAFDANVKRALEEAAANGWTIPVQYRASDFTAKNIEADFLESNGTQYVDTLLYVKPESGFYGEATASLKDSSFETLAGFHIYFLPFAVVPTTRRICFAYGNQDTTYYPQKDGSLVPSVGSGAQPNDKFYLYEGRFKVGMNFKESATWEYETANTTAKIALPYAPFAQTRYTMTLFGRRFLSGGGSVSVTNTYMWRGRIYSAIFSEGPFTVRKFVPVLDNTGTPCMYDTVSGQNFYNANTAEGAIPFTVGFDTTEKAAVSLSRLPVTTGGELTVSLPAEAEEDELVDEACRIAESRGWTIFPQYREG